MITSNPLDEPIHDAIRAAIDCRACVLFLNGRAPALAIDFPCGAYDPLPPDLTQALLDAGFERCEYSPRGVQRWRLLHVKAA